MTVVVCGKAGAGKSSVIEAIASEVTHSLPFTYIMHRSMVINQTKEYSRLWPPKYVKHGCPKHGSLTSGEVGCAVEHGLYSTSTSASPDENMSFPHASSSNFKTNHSVSLLYFIDTGGLPEFYDILPFVLPNKSHIVVLYVINLSKYLPDHDTDIMHVMQLMNPKQSTTCYKIAVIGTHKDQEHECMETRLQKNRKLQEMLNGLSVQDNHMVAYHGRHELIFPLNTKHLCLEDLQTVSKLRDMVLTEKLQTLQDSITDTTFLLFQRLQTQMKALNRSVMRRSECLAIARQLHLTESSFETALNYLSKQSMLHYYGDELPDVVLDQRVLVDKTAEIVEYCHHLRKDSTAFSCLTPEGKLRKYGILTHELLSGFGFDETFTEANLLKLLMNQLIVAECSPNEYLMPCLIPVEEFSEPLSNSRAPSLLLSFQSGESPAGLFCALVCHLISHESWKLAIGRKSNSPTQLTRKRIQFISGEYMGTITLSEFPSCFEVNIALASDSLDCFYSAFCAKVRKDIWKAVSIALSILGYGESRMPQEAFYCTMSDCISSPHPAVIQSGYQWIKCTHNPSTEVIKLTPQHRQWFGTMHGKVMCSTLFSLEHLHQQC